MALQTFVKINNITNLSDARYCSGMYANLLGFSLDSSSEKYVNPSLFGEITGWLSGVELTGEFSFEFHPDILEILKEYPAITWIEYDRLEELKSLAGGNYSLIYKMSLEAVKHIEPEVAREIDESGIIFHVFSKDDVLSEDDLEVVKKLASSCKVILGTGITPENVLHLINSCGLFGISLAGGDEIKPGLRDFDLMADILEKLEVED
jgi:phosphoribosylanthranilate isomerase